MTFLHTLCERGRRWRDALVRKVSREEEHIRPLASIEASINEQPGNVSIHTLCSRRPGQGNRGLGMWIIEVLFWMFKWIMARGSTVNRCSRDSKWQQTYPKHTHTDYSNHECKTCWVTLLRWHQFTPRPTPTTYALILINNDLILTHFS